ncbi:hypothetical protein WJX73_010582 [Symbiochloris irregularis]|uniref:Protein kinase domain-containing protein n=1 Tax=Symbiochloris irregularis TaxID=706552 RepID=A0AAW1NQL9_9CHLO
MVSVGARAEEVPSAWEGELDEQDELPVTRGSTLRAWWSEKEITVAFHVQSGEGTTEQLVEKIQRAYTAAQQCDQVVKPLAVVRKRWLDAPLPAWLLLRWSADMFRGLKQLSDAHMSHGRLLPMTVRLDAPLPDNLGPAEAARAPSLLLSDFPLDGLFFQPSEAFQSLHYQDGKADIWRVMAILLTLISREHPWHGHEGETDMMALLDIARAGLQVTAAFPP